MDLKTRRVAQFRCHYDPQIGGKPKQAFNLKEMNVNVPEDQHCVAEMTPVGVYVKLLVGGPGAKTQQEHLVPYANIQSIMLAPEEAEAKAAPRLKAAAVQ